MEHKTITTKDRERVSKKMQQLPQDFMDFLWSKNHLTRTAAIHKKNNISGEQRDKLNHLLRSVFVAELSYDKLKSSIASALILSPERAQALFTDIDTIYSKYKNFFWALKKENEIAHTVRNANAHGTGLPPSISKFLEQTALNAVFVKIFPSLTDNHRLALSHVVQQVFWGKLPLSGLVEQIAKELAVDPSVAQQIASKLQEFVFAKYKGFIRDVYAGDKTFEQVVVEYKKLEEKPAAGEDTRDVVE